MHHPQKYRAVGAVGTRLGKGIYFNKHPQGACDAGAPLPLGAAPKIDHDGGLQTDL